MRGRRVVIAVYCFALLFSAIGYPESPQGRGQDRLTPDTAWETLVEGNKSFASGKSKHPHESERRRAELSKRQQAFAVVVGCSDSRVPPEVLFDQGFGDMMVVRTGGGVVREIEIGTIEYAVTKLDAPLIVVLGHDDCCAIDTAIKGGSVPGSIGSVVDMVKPAVDAARGRPGDLAKNAVRENVRLISERILSSPVVKRLVEQKRLRLVKASYDMEKGTVSVIE